jgi:formate-dependent nitrite reductase membrane component NrfD
MVISLGTAGVDARVLTAGNLILLTANIILIALYLWTATYAGPTTRESVRELTRGSLALAWGIGVVLFGIIIPLVISLLSYFSGGTPALALAIVIIVSEIIGGLAFTYSVLKVGVYSPLVPGYA